MITGKGIYIWQLKRCEGGDMGKVVNRLKAADMTHVLPKIADGDDPDIKTIVDNWKLLPDLVNRCHKAGIQVIGWQYVYGANPTGEADRAITELRKLPFDGFVINAERQYRDLANNAQAAWIYCEKIRAAYPDLLLGLSSYRFPHYHAKFPFNTFLSFCDFNMPQVYWMQSNGTVPAQLADTIKAYEPYVYCPMIPTGAAFEEHGWKAVPDDQRIFVEEVRKHGLSGCNWWEYWEAFHRNPELGNIITNIPFEETTMSEPLTKLYYPCDPKYRLTQIFGVNPKDYPTSRGHNGIDFGTPVGSPIYAAWDGTIEVATSLTYGYGRHVRIRHSHGLTIYGHLSRIDVKVGDKIKAKELVGLSGGATSDPYAGMSTGPHLHFEYRWDKPAPQVPGGFVYNAVDPLPLLVLHELPEPDENADYYHIVIKGNLTIRAIPAYPEGPALGHVLLGDLPYKSYEKAKDKNNRDWFKIERNGVIGWIAGYTQWTEITKIYAPAPPEPDPDPEPLTLEERVTDLERRMDILEAK